MQYYIDRPNRPNNVSVDNGNKLLLLISGRSELRILLLVCGVRGGTEWGNDVKTMNEGEEPCGPVRQWVGC